MKTFINAIALIICFTAVSCSSSNRSSKKQKDPNSFVTNTMATPAAQGNVNTSVDPNGNTKLNIQVKHLANPEMLSQGANAYVVWVQPQGTEMYQNIGTLRVNDNLEGTYKTSVPYKSFRVMITPESNTQAQRPTGVTVLERSVNL